MEIANMRIYEVVHPSNNKQQLNEFVFVAALPWLTSAAVMAAVSAMFTAWSIYELYDLMEENGFDSENMTDDDWLDFSLLTIGLIPGGGLITKGASKLARPQLKEYVPWKKIRDIVKDKFATAKKNGQVPKPKKKNEKPDPAAEKRKEEGLKKADEQIKKAEERWKKDPKNKTQEKPQEKPENKFNPFRKKKDKDGEEVDSPIVDKDGKKIKRKETEAEKKARLKRERAEKKKEDDPDGTKASKRGKNIGRAGTLGGLALGSILGRDKGKRLTPAQVRSRSPLDYSTGKISDKPMWRPSWEKDNEPTSR